MLKDELRLLESFQGLTVLVVGDIMVDQYTHGSVSRISPEAPVPIVRKESDRYALGGAANVAHNVASLGAKAILCGVVGNDQRKDIVRAKAQAAHIAVDAVVVDESRQTTLKHRIVSGANHQLVRIDDESSEPLSVEIEDAVLSKVLPIIPTVNAVVFSDYVKGFFTSRVTKEILEAAQRSSIPVYADIKPENRTKFVGVDLVTPNVKEAEELTGLSDVRDMGKKISEFFRSDVVITRGSDGMSIFERNGREVAIPSKKISVFDVSGAGDTVIAVLSLARAAGADIITAATCANAAGAVVVQKAGTAVLEMRELKEALGIKSTGNEHESVSAGFDPTKIVEHRG